MKIYFLKGESDNSVIITDGVTAKIYNGAPAGVYDGIDLYEDDVVANLQEHFASTLLNNYSDISCTNEVNYADIEKELEDAVLVYEE